MARTVQQIQTQIKQQWVSDPNLSAANSTSQTAFWNLITFIVASAIAIFEQLQDIYKMQLETIASQAVPGTLSWVRAQVLKFQYSATDTQVISLVDFVPQYPIVDPTLCIVTNCAVITNTNNVVEIKVAKESPPVQLASGEVTALTTYLSEIMFAGIPFSVVNLASDKLSIGAVIYYNGQYAAVISANVISALENYMASLPFDGTVKMSDIENAILAVTGVTDVVFSFIKCRKDTDLFSAAYTVYNLSTNVNNRKYQTQAGYISEETTSSETFTDTLSFVIAN